MVRSLLLVLACTVSCLAGSWTSQRHGFSLDFDDGLWQVVEPQHVRCVVQLQERGGSRAIFVLAVPVKPGVQFDEAFIRGVDAAALKVEPPANAVRKLSSRRLNVGGRPGYEIETRVELEDSHLSALNRVVLVRDLSFHVMARCSDAQAGSDSALVAVLDSFRFELPAVPPPATPTPTVPSVGSGPSLWRLALVFGVVLVFGLFVVWGKRRR